jgi:RNase P/RNase MRP subunit p29
MTTDLRRVVRGELIGKTVEVTQARTAAYRGITGRVVDETAAMVVIETSEGKEKRIMKQGTMFAITGNGKRIEVAGELLAGAPEERVKARTR